MTLKDKQELYNNFKSKVEAACMSMVHTRVLEKDVSIKDNFIIDEIIPELWDHFETILDKKLSKKSKKIINL